MILAVLAAVVCLQDPSDQLRRDELSLRLRDLADSQKLDGFSRAVLRELGGKRIDGPLLDQCWRPVARRTWEGTLPRLIDAWDKAAAEEAPSPGRALYRVRLERLASPKAAREKLEEAARAFPGEPLILWDLGTSRFKSSEYGPAAGALEALAALKGAVFDVDDFHRMLVRCYAETDRAAAAVEHLRAISDASADVRDRAILASRCRLPAEAARLYRLAFGAEPERSSLRIPLIASLSAAGETREAAAERRKIFQVDGAVLPANVEEYFNLLPPRTRTPEIVASLRQLLDDAPDGVSRRERLDGLSRCVPGECRGAVMTQWEADAGAPPDLALLALLKRRWGPPADAIGSLEAADKRFPRDPWILREKIEALDALGRFKEVADTYALLAEADPKGKTGPRPYGPLSRAVRDLGDKDPSAAMALALRSLAEPVAEESARAELRGALREAWDKAGPGVWEELRKQKPPRAPADIEARVRIGIGKLSADEFQVRTRAAAELKKLGVPAVSALLPYLEDPDAEVSSRVRDVLRAILTD